jgi:beta-galactosidase/beta-glucuronidase
MSNDPATDHFMSQGVHVDDFMNGHQQMWEKAQEPAAPERTYEDDEHYAAARSAHDEVQSRSAERDDWEASRSDREYFSQKYPDAKLSYLLQLAHQWQETYKQDPVRAAELMRRNFKRSNPFGKVATPEVKSEEPPSRHVRVRKSGLVFGT